MMQGIIAVEKSLSRLFDTLETQGYEVVELNKQNVDGVDAIVVSGADINLMNMQDTLTDVPIINATGKTADEILDELNNL